MDGLQLGMWSVESGIDNALNKLDDCMRAIHQDRLLSAGVLIYGLYKDLEKTRDDFLDLCKAIEVFTDGQTADTEPDEGDEGSQE